MKTNKSFTKRIKTTPQGKLLARKPGQNHFRAKKSRAEKLDLKRPNAISLHTRTTRRFLPGKKVR